MRTDVLTGWTSETLGSLTVLTAGPGRPASMLHGGRRRSRLRRRRRRPGRAPPCVDRAPDRVSAASDRRAESGPGRLPCGQAMSRSGGRPTGRTHCRQPSAPDFPAFSARNSLGLNPYASRKARLKTDGPLKPQRAAMICTRSAPASGRARSARHCSRRRRRIQEWTVGFHRDPGVRGAAVGRGVVAGAGAAEAGVSRCPSGPGHAWWWVKIPGSIQM